MGWRFALYTSVALCLFPGKVAILGDDRWRSHRQRTGTRKCACDMRRFQNTIKNIPTAIMAVTGRPEGHPLSWVLAKGMGRGGGSALTLPSPAGTCSRHKPLGAGGGLCWGLPPCMRCGCLPCRDTVLWGHRWVWTACHPCPWPLGG